MHNWHELEEKWYREYLRKYEPNKFFKRKKEAVIKQFKNNGNLPKEALKKLDTLFSDFVKKLIVNKKDMSLVNQIVMDLVFELNTLNSLHNFIETEEREAILEYVNDLLKSHDCTDALEVMDVFREW